MKKYFESPLDDFESLSESKQEKSKRVKNKLFKFRETVLVLVILSSYSLICGLV